MRVYQVRVVFLVLLILHIAKEMVSDGIRAERENRALGGFLKVLVHAILCIRLTKYVIISTRIT